MNINKIFLNISEIIFETHLSLTFVQVRLTMNLSIQHHSSHEISYVNTSLAHCKVLQAVTEPH